MDHLLPSFSLLVAAAAATTIPLAFLVWSRNKRPYPPGPPGWPFIGNVLQLPSCHLWITLSDWAVQYGDLVYLTVVGQPILVINSANAAKDLLDKRSAIYSDRPRLVMANELSGNGESFISHSLDGLWQRQRKLIAQELNPSSIQKYCEIQELEARKFARNIIGDNVVLRTELQLRIGTIISRVTYGYVLKGSDDPILKEQLKAMANFAQAVAPGKFLVDVIPQLKHMPRWMPGAGFRKTADEWKSVVIGATRAGYVHARQSFQSGNALLPNICASNFETMHGPAKMTEEQDSDLMWSVSTVTGGGLDTNISTLLVFILAMILHPEVQAKARAEIDALIGTHRLPNISDVTSLPFVRSVFTEVLRWHQATPLAIPHSLREDDIYRGNFIPKGTLVLSNVWHMCHDPNIYPDPMTFNPERYGNDNTEMQKVIDVAFGFGRRICPGRYFAQGTIYAVMMTLITTCDILPGLGQDDRPEIPKLKSTNGIIVFPEAFKYRFKPRSKIVVELLNQAISENE